MALIVLNNTEIYQQYMPLETSMSNIIAVLLSGCGHQDGAEIHEATLTLWAIHSHGADYQCFAPDIGQHHVLNHITGEEMAEQRSVLIESARIARGAVKPLSEYRAGDFAGLVIPGGFGAAKNLCTYAFDGIDCTVNEHVARAVRETHEAGKPLGALCIAPVILAKVLGKGTMSIGQDETTAKNMVAMGARHEATWQGEVCVDRENKLVTTPCYMLDSRVDQIAAGADGVIRAMLELS
jgi:enhancing lycopene biosynthesis protein 2